jgi:ferredoxin-NADP reductase
MIVAPGSAASGPPRPPTRWTRAVVRDVSHPIPHSVVLRLEVPERITHRPGQHYVVRLTAEDGYRASRSYSVASAPGDPLVELFVQRLDDGEVSTYLADTVAPGDELEVRGPIGGWFAWDADGAALGVGGGTGVVPLVAMLRHAAALGRLDLLRLVVAARTLAELPYADELTAGGARLALSRADVGVDGRVGVNGGVGRRAGRLAAADLQGLLSPEATGYVCGAEHASQLLIDLGLASTALRIERFGPSGA